MQGEDERIARHLLDLARRAERNGTFTFSPFLGLAEQDVFHRLVERELPVPATAFGGLCGCERVMLRFGDAELLGYEEPFPIAALYIEARSEKYAEALTHRDYLGALMNLGIERDVLGDILVRAPHAYLMAAERMVPFLEEGLVRVRHTDVRVRIATSVPEGELFRTEPLLLQAMGERLDAVIAKLYRISRADALALFHRGLVFVGGRVAASPSVTPRAGEVISVRGYGRFIYRGYQSDTRKGKMNLLVERYV